MSDRTVPGGGGWAWWLYRIPVRERLVYLAGVTIRLAGVILLGYVLPLVWAHLPYPGWSALLAAGLVAESLLVLGWWTARQRADPITLLIDLPTGALALVAGAILVNRDGPFGWTMFVYPYTIMISFCFGLVCRPLLGALGCGLLWAAAGVAGLALFYPEAVGTPVLFVLSYQVMPAVGWGCAQLLRRNSDDLQVARAAAVRQTADLATAAQRARLSTALHDRILQSLETLSRSSALAGEALRERVRANAAWLRRYVETGQLDQSEDLTVGLDAAARAAQRAGLAVEVNDARLRAFDPTGGLATEQRRALVDAAYQTINAFGAGDGEIVVRAAPEDGGILVSVLSTGDGLPDAQAIADARSRLAAAGGWLTIEAVPYAELWVPRET
jgi:hypothetical protein